MGIYVCLRKKGISCSPVHGGLITSHVKCKIKSIIYANSIFGHVHLFTKYTYFRFDGALTLLRPSCIVCMRCYEF